MDTWKNIFNYWLDAKKYAKASNDYTYYIWFLKEFQKHVSVLYAKATSEDYIALFGQMLKDASCELQESIIKYDNKIMPTAPTQPKTIENMSNDELLSAYKKGMKWLTEREQITGTTNNTLGKIYNHSEWKVGLARMEKIEAELIIRKIAY